MLVQQHPRRKLEEVLYHSTRKWCKFGQACQLSHSQPTHPMAGGAVEKEEEKPRRILSQDSSGSWAGQQAAKVTAKEEEPLLASGARDASAVTPGTELGQAMSATPSQELENN